jgi:integrase
VVKTWDSFVRNNLPDTALWFYPFENHWGDYTLAKSVGDRTSSNALIDRFKSIYEKAGMKELYKSPHKYRHGHAVYSLSKCKTMADYQAVSRNLMHSSLAITDGIYADNERKERQSVISSFMPENHPVIEDDLRNYLMSLSRDDQKEAMRILVNEVIQ